jgi:uncharacterized protein YoxC
MSDLNNKLKNIYEDIQQKETKIAQTLSEIEIVKQNISKLPPSERKTFRDIISNEFKSRSTGDSVLSNEDIKSKVFQIFEKNIIEYLKLKLTTHGP